MERHSQRKKLERVAERIVRRHRELDDKENHSDEGLKDSKTAELYRRKVARIKAFLDQGTKKQGPTGNDQKAMSPIRTAPR